MDKVIIISAFKEQLIFPEIEYDAVERIRGMDIAIVTTAIN